MGTRGYFAYRYRGKYYRIYVHCDAYPEGYGWGVAREIPRNPEALKTYIEKMTKALQVKEQRDKLFSWEEYVVCTGTDWTLGDTMIEWTYVIDFDHLVLTVNGAVHFPFDKIPPLESSDSEPGFVGYLESYKRIEIPAKYLTTIDHWPAPRFDVTRAQQQYDGLQPIILALPEWGAPSWDSLSVSQRLGTSIIKTLVYDYSDELSLAHYSSCQRSCTLESDLPSLDSTPQKKVLYVRSDLVKQPSKKVQTIHGHMGGKGTLGRYCWFRGCLVTFCPRLDEPVYMMHQIGEMVQHLRSHAYERTTGIGIIMSGFQIIGVAIDGSAIRHTPVLDLHDGRELKDGVLLLTHLLSPAFTTSKTPWRAEPPIHQPHHTSSLPDDILRQIIHFADLETYLSLRFVSRHVRSIYLSYPRVGNYILLSYELNANSGPLFKVRSTSSTCSILATLMRTKATITEPDSSGRSNATNPGSALWMLARGEEYNTKVLKYFPRPVLFREMIKQDVHNDMRIQAVDGIWEMVTTNSPVAGKRNPSARRELYERMTGFNTDELYEMSEAEKCHYLSD